MRIKYFETANRDVTKSPGWLKKLLLLGLLYFIPVFGWIVAQGYLYGWAREAALGTYRLMPARIFGNEDGQLYKRGWRVFVVQLVYTLIPSLIMIVSSVVILGFSFYATAAPLTTTSSATAASTAIGIMLICLLLILIAMLLYYALLFFAWAGAIRTSVYGSIAIGLQFGEVYRMLKRDFGGILRIFGMYLLVTLIASVALEVVILLVSCLAGAFVGALAAAATSGAIMESGAEIALLFGVSLLAMTPVYYLQFVCTMYVTALSTRALGYWAQGVMPDLWQAAPQGFKEAE
jgi:hypothetical protein